ncbi:MAG TPA: Mur ligase family protein [Candidatus Paceibacterota bacterium]
MKLFLKKIIVTLLEWEARLVLRKYKPRIIAVTGSVGKTTTKDAIYALLAPSFHVRKSEKSFNSEIGIPLTILGVPNAWSNIVQWVKNLVEGFGLILLSSDYPRILVLEVGADRPGDIKHVASWLTPQTVVLTRFPDVPVHVEYFESPEHLIEEKMHLVKAVAPAGTLILNFDDPQTQSISLPSKGSMLTYGMHDGADVVGTQVVDVYDTAGVVCGISFHVAYQHSSEQIVLNGVLGKQHIYPTLAALAVGISEGLTLSAMADELKEYAPPPGRMRLIKGINESLIIDDTYNASPVATLEALSVLATIKTEGNKIAVLGDMLELGNYSVPAHKEIGALVAQSADRLVTVGIRSHYTAEMANKKRMKKKSITITNDSREAGNKLKGNIGKGDVILVKGSQSMRMERVVEMLMAEPEKAKELLVRQDDVWRSKV